MGEDQRDNCLSDAGAETQEKDERCRESSYFCGCQSTLGESEEGRKKQAVISGL